MQSITESELIHLLESARIKQDDEDDGWLTMKEIADALGCTVFAARNLVREQTRLGHIEVRKGMRPSDLTGFPAFTYIYRMKGGDN